MDSKYIYFHIFTDGAFEVIVREMMECCRDGGLLDDIHEVRYFVVGPHVDAVNRIMAEFPKTRLVRSGRDSHRQYERFTLHDLYEFSKDKPDSYILYMHSKGVSRKSRWSHAVHQWRKDMLYGLVIFRELCWDQLRKGADAVGSFMRNHPSLHFSGNFWWTTTHYIAQLPFPIPGQYLEPEMWIGRRMDLGVSLVQSNDNLYNYCMPIETYRQVIQLSYHPRSPYGYNDGRCVVWRDVRSVECGAGNRWIQCTIPPDVADRPSVVLCMDTFPPVNREDPFYGVVKQFRICYRREDASPVVFLENTKIVPHFPAERCIPMDDIVQCFYTPEDRSSKTNVTDILRRSRSRYNMRVLGNSIFHHDPYPNVPKMICFELNNSSPRWFHENETVFFT